VDDALPEVIVHALAAWFRDHGRPYFFRRHPTAYSVWILEVMSQQTQIARAEERHRRWLEHFPDIQALAAASESEVLREWEGLGYYSRARNIHKAARQVLDAGGEMPATRDELIRLPGIGAYTAASIASIVHGEPVAALDANVRRVMARVFSGRGLSDKEISAILETAFRSEPPGVINEALMELGEQVCRRSEPRCETCPLAACCVAKSTGQTTLVRRQTGGRIRLRMVVACLRIGDRVYVEVAPRGELWTGLWRPPCRTIEPDEVPEEQVASLVRETGCVMKTCEPLKGRFTGSHTRYSITFFPYRIGIECGPDPVGRGAWIGFRDDGGRTFPTVFRRILDAVFAPES